MAEKRGAPTPGFSVCTRSIRPGKSVDGARLKSFSPLHETVHGLADPPHRLLRQAHP
jgi:hypothetical protein